MRTIPIVPAESSTACADEGTGEVPNMSHLPLARRGFLKGSGVLMGTLAAGSVLAALAPPRARR